MRRLDISVHGIFPVYFADGAFVPEAIEEPLAYVLDGAGWKLYKRNGVTEALIALPSVNGLPMADARIDLTAVKLPLDLIRRVTAWFRAVYLRYKSEAVGDLYYSSIDGWDFVVPPQTVSAASAKYDAAPRRDGWTLAGTIHSHAAMSAFHSGTDDHDEMFFDGVHITIGKLDSVPEYSCSLVVQGVRRIVDPSEIVDGMAPADAVPEAWLAAIKLPRPTLLAEPFAAQAVTVYERYWRDEIGEAAYKVALAEIEAAEKTARVPAVEAASPFTVGQLSRPFAGGNKSRKRGKR